MSTDSNEGVQNDAERKTITGTVKWFNAAKGFGFVTPNDGSGDVFLHLSCLREAGFDSVEDGAAIVCEAAQRPKGLQAIRIVQLDQSGARQPKRQARPARPSMAMPLGTARIATVVAEGDFQAATVKWFNPGKGYGFVSCGDAQQDVFIHMQVLRRQGIIELQAGQAVRVRIGQGPKGPQVAEIELS